MVFNRFAVILRIFLIVKMTYIFNNRVFSNNGYYNKYKSVLLREFSDLRFIGKTILKFSKERKKAGEWSGSDWCLVQGGVEYPECKSGQKITGRQESGNWMESKSGRWLLEVRNILNLRNVVFFLAAVLLKQGQNVVEVCTRVRREQVLHVGVDCPPGDQIHQRFLQSTNASFQEVCYNQFHQQSCAQLYQ